MGCRTSAPSSTGPEAGRSLRLHITSAGVPPETLVPGRDLVLRLPDGHGLDVAVGVAADDYLDIAARRAIDQAALVSWSRWRAVYDAPLTVERVVLPFVSEWPLFARLLARLRAGVALRAALEANRATELEVGPGSPDDLRMIRAVGRATGVTTREIGAGPGRGPSAGPSRRVPLRRRAIGAALSAGAPTVLRRGSVLTLTYWPLVPLVDALLAAPGERVAIPLDKRPPGVSRGLRCLLQGGWIGKPGARARRHAAAAVAGPLERAAAGPAPDLGLQAFDLGECVHRELVRTLSVDAASHLAMARLLRRAYTRRPPRLVLGTYDTLPLPRLAVSLARERGIRTLLLAHGVYVMPQSLPDLSIGDEVALWSEVVAPPGLDGRSGVHTVGYPLPAAQRDGTPDPAKVVVLGQNGHLYTAMFDERIVVRHFDAALAAISAARPGARVVLRPHPIQPLEPVHDVMRRHRGLDVSVDVKTPILPLLAGAGLCIGSQSAATLQAALVGCPVVLLNLTGYDWPWPLGGETPVPLARSPEELGALLAVSNPGPGTEASAGALLHGLGADRPGAVGRLLALVAGPGPGPGPSAEVL